MPMLLAVSLSASFAFASDAALAPAPLPILPDARFALALYCNPTCTDELVDQLDEALAGIRAADEFSEHVAVPSRIMGMAGADFGIPDEEFVTDFGEGVGDPQRLAASQEVVLAWFASPREQSIETFAAAHAAFAAAARSTGGWVEDLDTQMLFGAAAWAERDPRGPIQTWFVVDSSPAKAGSLNERLVTRGLRRYGDFDLVVDDVAPDVVTDVGWALDAIAETLHPLAEVPPEQAVATETAKGTARFTLAELRDDDPSEALLRVRFAGDITVDDGTEDGPLVAAEAPVGGGEPPARDAPIADVAVVPAPRAGVAPRPQPAPRTLGEAEAEVRSALVTLEAAWDRGLPVGDHLAVSAPFTTGTGGREYLWVELTRWAHGELSGRLATEPSAVVGLHLGDEVVVSQADVFDYVYKHADGTKDGNLTRPFR